MPKQSGAGFCPALAVPAAVILSLVPGVFAQSVLAQSKGEWTVYVGTYTRENSKGIYACRLQPATGRLTPAVLAAETVNPSFLAVHPNHRFLYAVNETGTFEGQPAGSVTAFAITSGTGELKLLNRVSSRGAGPCHVSVDGTGKWLFVANYSGGSTAAFPIHENGRVGEASAFVQHTGSSVNPQRQQGPHAHMAVPSPDNRFVLVPDLGLDRILVYRLDAAKGVLTPHEPSFVSVIPGSGPRHLAFRPGGRFVYVIDELTSTVTAFGYDSRSGSLKDLQTISTLPDRFAGNNSGAEIAVHPNGKFLYASNRGHDSIAVFAIDSDKGTLKAIDHTATQGKTPRNFAIDPTGSYLFTANQDSGRVVVFRIEQRTGKLTPTGSVLEVPFPVCVTFAPAE